MAHVVAGNSDASRAMAIAVDQCRGVMVPSAPASVFRMIGVSAPAALRRVPRSHETVITTARVGFRALVHDSAGIPSKCRRLTSESRPNHLRERNTHIMKARRISIAAAALLLVAAIATAQPIPNAQHPGGGRAALVHYLQLTPDQIAAWQQIHKDTAAAVKPLATQAHDLRTQLEAAVKATTPDPAAVGKLTLALRSVREQVRATRSDSKDKLLAVLTPEQKTKFEAFEAARAALRHRRGN